MDTAMVTQTLARQKELNSEEESFDTFGHVPILNAQPPSEIIVICLDISKSMDSDADFPDMNRKDEDEENGDEDEDKFDVTKFLPDSYVEWSNQEAQGHSPFLHVIYFDRVSI